MRQLDEADLDVLAKCKYVGEDMHAPLHGSDEEYG